MKKQIIETGKFLGYITFMPLYMIVGCVYKPLKWIVFKCSNFDADYEKAN